MGSSAASALNPASSLTSSLQCLQIAASGCCRLECQSVDEAQDLRPAVVAERPFRPPLGAEQSCGIGALPTRALAMERGKRCIVLQHGDTKGDEFTLDQGQAGGLFGLEQRVEAGLRCAPDLRAAMPELRDLAVRLQGGQEVDHIGMG